MKLGTLKDLSRNHIKDKIIDKRGYILIYAPCNPFSRNGYVLEHRLIVEQKINRLLTPNETIHHINGKKDDNRIDNLFLFKSQKDHKSFENQVQQFGFTQPILTKIKNRWNEYEKERN